MIKTTKSRITKLGVSLAMALCLSGATAAPALASGSVVGPGMPIWQSGGEPAPDYIGCPGAPHHDCTAM